MRTGRVIIPKLRERSARSHQILKSRILVNNNYLLSDLELQIDAFVGYYNQVRYYESIGN
jgi:hypothetical protein